MDARISRIKARLKATTVEGPWEVVASGHPVLYPGLSTKDNPFFYAAEDDSILGGNGEEVLGASEWIRCEWENLEFMAHAKEDIEFLLKKLNVY